MKTFLNIFEHVLHLIHIVHDLIEHPSHGKYILYSLLIIGGFLMLVVILNFLPSRSTTVNQPTIISIPKPLNPNEVKKIQRFIISLVVTLILTICLFIYFLVKRFSM